MEINYRYNSNRSQVEAYYFIDTNGRISFIMDVKDFWSKKEFFEQLVQHVFGERWSVDIENALKVTTQVFGELTKQEISFYKSYYDEIKSRLSYHQIQNYFG